MTLSQSGQLKLDFRLINVVGIDGSGKTTLCRKLVKALNNGYMPYKYVHSYHEPILLKPFKLFAKAFFLREVDEFGDYKTYRKQKATASNKHKILVRIYALVWILDYLLQTIFIVCLPRMTGKCLLVDRYIYDAVLNASLTANLPSTVTYRIIDNIFRIFPKPDIVFMVDLSEEVAFNRKNDIQSVEYLKEHRQLYLEMSNRYGFIIINGQDTPQEILADVMRSLV